MIRWPQIIIKECTRQSRGAMTIAEVIRVSISSQAAVWSLAQLKSSVWSSPHKSTTPVRIVSRLTRLWSNKTVSRQPLPSIPIVKISSWYYHRRPWNKHLQGIRQTWASSVVKARSRPLHRICRAEGNRKISPIRLGVQYRRSIARSLSLTRGRARTKACWDPM